MRHAGQMNPGGGTPNVCLADRVHSYSGTPISYLFQALTTSRSRWLVLQPGEVEPQVLDAIPKSTVVWSSFWPASPDFIIQFDLTGTAGHSELRFRWFTDHPPDERGIAIMSGPR